ncbi:hypothetical protein [Streptomyces montanus]|uniref:hypothetical protein n=1 Tax=Streptomyces montanus TaxID=2580423 RepID=UPI00267C843A
MAPQQHEGQFLPPMSESGLPCPTSPGQALASQRRVTDEAAALLRGHRLRGHKYAMDAVLAVIARSAQGPVTIVTSDPEDISLLCGPAIEVIKV